MNRLLSLSLALAASALLLIGLLAGSRSASVHAQQGGAPTPTPATVPGPVFDIQSLPLEGKVSPPRYPNLDSNLNRVVEQARTGQLTTRAAAASAPLHYSQSVAVTLYIIEGYADAIASYLEANGASPRNIDADYIEAYIPVSLLAEASEREGVLSARTIIPPHPDQGSVVSGGVAAHGVPSWHAAGYKGRDVKIGVIDLSFKGFAGLMGSELPATVQARCYASVGNFTTNLSDCISTSSPERSRRHGTAVTEALFDIAPQADYYISDAGSYRDLLNTVNWMVSQGVDVINMSLAWGFDGPGDGTTYYSNAPLKSVDAAVNGGIIWVNGAGNSARDSWYGAFEDSDSDGVHEFNASGNECNRATIDLDPLEGFTAQLRWADSWGGASKDLNLYLISDPGSTFSLSDAVATSENNQVGAGNDIPYEWISIDHGDIANGEYCLAVNQTSGAAPSWIQLLLWGASDDLQNYVSAHSIGNPAESRNSGMLAAGAAPFSNTSTIESFSSRGPTTDNRTKPDIVGADGGTSSTRGTWKGTSQASPHVAGLAALVKQVYPSRSPSSIASYLKDNALGRDTVPNNTWGYGFARLPPPPDATLSALTLSDIDFGTLTSDTTSYFASVANSVTQTMITPTLNDSEASYVIKIGGVTDEDGTVSLAEGINVITVEVTDDDDETKKSYTVTVSRIGTLALTYKENGTASLHTLSANGLEQSTTTWSLEGTDYYYFTIGSTGILSFASSPDYESPADSGGDNVYEVTVSAKDAVLNSTAVEVTVTVEDVDEPPLITGVSTIDDYDENGSGDVATYTAIDPEGDSNVTWSLAGADRGDFDITGGVLTFRNVPDYEHAADSGGNNHYEVTVQATDANNKRGELHIDVIVKNVDEPPVITGPDTVDDYPENSAASRQVGRYTASDPEGATVTLSLTGTDSDDFTFASNVVLTFKESPDYEEQRSYRVTVRAEAGSHTVDRVVTVNIQNVEEPGTVTFSKVQPQEGTQITATLDDDDGPTGITWQWYRTSSRGSNGNPITNADSESYTPGAADVGSYLRAVASYDDGYGDDKNAAAVSSNRVQEAPPAPAPPVFPADGDYDRTIRENLRAGRNVGAPVTASDGNNDRLTYSIAASDEFEIVESTGQLRTKAELDYEGREQHFVTVTATDPGGLTDTVSVTITVTDVNEGPEISRVGSAPGSVRENYDPSLVLARYTATDPEEPSAQITRWSTSGTDGGDFVISEQGELRFRNSPDYERPADSNRDNVYVFTVQVSDGRVYGNFEETVTVTPVDEPPTITTTSTLATELRQNENQTSRLYTYRATDPEGSTVTWAAGGVDGRFFTIDERGQFSFKQENPPDFEQPGDSGGDNVYDVTVQVRDDGFNTASLPVKVTVREVNEGPEVTSGQSAFTISENQDLPNAVYSGFDPEGGTVTRWTVGGRDGGDFKISQEGTLTFRNTPDYERPADSNRDNIYELQVRPYDGRYYGSFDVTVTVTDVNEPPTITTTSSSATALQQKENQTSRLYTYRATDPEQGTITWLVGGTDGRFFTIDERGQFSFSESSPPDFEHPGDSGGDNVYDVTIQARDDGGTTASLPVTVTVANDAESVEPTIGTRRPPSTYRENGTSAVYTFRASDPQRQSITWTLEGTDRGDFTITGDSSGRGVLAFSVPPDFEDPSDSDRQNDYELTVIVSDEDGHSDRLSFTVTVTDVNEGPEVSGPSAFTIAENQGLSNAVYSATDPEGANVARWSVGGRDGGDFSITQGGTLYFRSPPDYERPADSNRDNVYELSIQPSDGRNTGSHPVTVTVTDVNEAPEIRRGSTTSFTQPENRTSRLYTYSATDPERGAITWSVGGTDGNHFTIDERGQFSFKEDSPPDFDTPEDDGRDNLYNITIEARDPESNTSRLPVTVMVTEVNEGPVITRQGSAPGSVPENHGVNQVLATYTASDPERPTVRITGWSTAGRDGGDFVINALGQLRFRNTPDYERPADSNRDNVYEVTIRASDGRNTGTLEEVQVVTVTDVNEPPTITTTSRTTFSQQENRTSVLYTFRATDPEGGTVTWTAAGTDGRFFAIDERGRFSFREDSPPDFDAPGDAGGDNVYNVTVQARDDVFNSATLDVVVTVTDHNENVEPTISTRRPPSTYRENGTSTIYTFRASDPQSGTTITWSLTGTDGGDFTIDRDSSGRGVLAFASPPDFESPADADRDNEYELAVVATDDEGNTDRVDFTIAVTNHNEGVEPSISTRRPPSTYRENNTSVVYTFRASDPQRGTTIRWSVTGNDGGDFTITRDSSGRGVLTFNSVPDFESPADANRDNEYELAVVAADGDGNSDRVDFTIAVTDINEGPQIRLEGAATTTVPENTADTQVLARFTATDPENPNAPIFQWSTSGRDGGDFVISELGELRFRSSPDYERPADSNRDNVYVFTVQVSDGRVYGNFEETVTVTPVDEPPTITTTSSSATELRQNENQTSRLYTYRATDPEGSTVTWAVGGTDGRYFAIDERGQFSFSESSPPDFEQPGDSGGDNVYDVTVQVRDDGFNTASLPVKVTVREVDEGPEVTSGQSAFTISENQDLPNAVYSGFDPEGGTVTRWTVGGRDGGDFKISQEGTLTFRNTPDYERPADSNRDNIYELQVRPYDDRYYGSFDVTVTVTDVDESPTITTTSSSATTLRQNENQTSRLYTYRATDPEQGTITWLVGGTDGRYFDIDERGQFSFDESSPPDFEQPGDSGRDNVYDATIQARDDGFNTASLPVTVTVANDAEGVEPTISTRRPPATYRENGTSAVYTFRASDPQRQSITWTLEGDDRRDFTITRDSSGRGVLAFSVPPDFEDPSDSDRQNDYELTVIVSDEDGHSDRLSFTINVTAVDEGPEVSGPSAFTIAENQGLSNAVYSATDPEGANVARWSVGGRDGGDFSITQGGTLYFRSPPDYERPADSNRDNVYELSIQPSDGRNTGSHPVTVTVTDVNEAPEIRRGSTTSFTQPENRTSRLYTYSATDPERWAITWSVGGTDGNHFTIDERGQFSFKEDSPPDFDTPGDDGGDNLYNVTIEARDPESNTSRLPVTVIVTEINEGPVITRQGNAPGSVPENHGVNQVLARYTASDPERPSVRITGWSTAGRDGGDFVMNALGQLRFLNSPDYERPADSNRDNVYEVTIRASDGRNTGTLEEVQVVTVTDVNEPPTITTTSRTTFSQQENRTSVLYTFRATDPEGGTVTWTAAGTDGRFFAIDEQGRFSFREDSPPDFDAPGDAGGDNVYNVTVQARDDVFNSSSLDVVVAVTDHNENVEPTITTRRPPSTYRENGTSTIYTFRASDPQSGTTITWSLTGTDGGDFTIDRDSSGRGVLAFASPPDFESPADADRDNEYELAVVATDDEGNTDRVDFTITVTNHNEGVEPTISTRRPPTTYRENGTSTVYTFRASDPQRGTTIRWSVNGTDAGDFTITRDSSGRGVLTFNSVPDFESPADSDQDNAYELAVVAADGYRNSDRVDFTITVTDVNEPPIVTLNGTATTTVPENTSDTQVLARFAACDPENPSAGIYWWSTSGRDGGDFVISELGELRFRSSPDYERPADSNRDNMYEVTIRASDGRSYGMLEEPLSVTVTEVNEAPVITTKSRTEFSLRENSTSVLYTYRATDQDNNDMIRWSVEGADGEDFAIYNGILTFRRLPDLENPVDADEDNVYEITVVAADRAGLRDTVSASITITDQPEGPVIAGRTSFTVTENYDITQVLGSYTATDAKDARTVHPQWSLSGRDSGDFVIDRDSGALTFRNTPDYDRPADGNRDNEYEVTVRGHDSRAYGNLNVTVTVTNINEEAPVVTGGNSHTVRENTTSSIYTYRATDSDLNDTIVWSVEGTDGDDFTINEEGALAFASAPDYEGPTDSDSDNVYEITVVAADGGGLRGTFEITVTVTELNEGPVVSGTATFTIDENQDLPSANYTATDPEATGGVTTSITWSVSGRDGGDFNIDRETGALTFRTPPDYERPADSNRDNEYEVTVRANDGRNYGTFDVTVTVLAVNEGPEITGRDTFRYRENGTSALYTYRATDPEGDEYTWDLGGLDAGDFEISDRGVLTFASPPNFDSPAGSGTDGNEYLMTVQARDDQGNTGELPVTITVTDQNEGATVSGRTEIAVQENRDPTLILATYTASDPEGQAITRWSLGGSDSGDFSISGDGELTFRNTPDYDRPADSNRDNEYRITVRAYDGGAYGNLDVTVTVSNQNEHDPIIRSGSRTSFNYREESTSTLYTYRATDQDKDDVITWTTAGTDGHLFEFDDRNALTFREQPDYEDPRDAGRDNEYELAVVATDSGGRSHRLDVTVAVTAVDEGPEITGTTTYTVAEGQELTGATFTARDPEDPTIDVINWRTSGTDGGDFTMSQDGELSFRSTPDYERPADSNRDNVYLLTVQASDGRNYGSLDVTVTVTDHNESNPVVSGRDALSVRENTTSTLYTYSARDMDRNAEIMWSVRGADSDDFTISDTGELSFSSNPDHEQPADSNRDNVYEITVVASDGQNEGTLDVTVTVTEVNEGPEISGSDTLTVSENYEAVLATYSGTDPEDASAEITRWSVTGRDGGDFTINEDGELTFRRPPDYERPADSDRDNEYEVTVRASDGKVYGIYEVAVNVEAVDEAPEFRRSSRDIFSYRENGASSLYTYRATDPEGAEVAWSVSGTDGGDFEISASGVLSFEEAPDYDDPSDDDDDNEYEVTVVATDQTGHAASLPVTVTVTDLNEGPIISGTGQFIVRENHDAVLGTYTGRDPEDPDMEITRWSVTGRDGGDFTINEDGELTFRNPPDYERPADGNRDNTYEVTVRASDGSYYGNFEVTVTVEAVNEPPDITGDEAISYQESSDRALETYRATDPEKTDITWGLSGADAGAFAISETGVLTFKNVPDYEEPADSDSDNVYEVTVEANDEDGETGRLEVTVTVTNVTD